MSESFKKSLRKGARDLFGSAIGVGTLALFSFLADPVATASVLKDPPRELLLVLPAINYVAKVAQDQVKHRFIPWLKDWLEEDAPSA